MSESNDRLLKKLDENISRLAELVDHYGHIKLTAPCFNLELFKATPAYSSYHDYLTEIRHNYQTLVDLLNKHNDDNIIERIKYLAELLVNQIQALQRALSTQDLSEKNRYDTSATETLYEKFNKNLDYLRRLETMRYELEQGDPYDQINLNKISVLNQRIIRCKQTINELELLIEKT